MPRTSKRGKKSSSASSRAGSSNGANGESPSVSARQNELTPRVNSTTGGNDAASASPSEQTKIMGARMSGVKHSGLLAKDGKEK